MIRHIPPYSAMIRHSKYFLPYQSAWIADPSRLKIMQKCRRASISYANAYDSVIKASPREAACVEQVAYWYQRRSQLGLASVSNESGVVQQFQSSALLPQVRAVLKRYVRWAN